MAVGYVHSGALFDELVKLAELAIRSKNLDLILAVRPDVFETRDFYKEEEDWEKHRQLQKIAKETAIVLRELNVRQIEEDLERAERLISAAIQELKQALAVELEVNRSLYAVTNPLLAIEDKRDQSEHIVTQRVKFKHVAKIIVESDDYRTRIMMISCQIEAFDARLEEIRPKVLDKIAESQKELDELRQKDLEEWRAKRTAALNATGAAQLVQRQKQKSKERLTDAEHAAAMEERRQRMELAESRRKPRVLK